MRKIYLLCALLCLIFMFGCENSDIKIDETPISDFEYENVDNNITITRYIGTDIHIVIPAKIKNVKVTEIGPACFENALVESVTLPSTIKIIGASAFEGCSALEDVIFPQELSKIKARAFADCISLRAITIPSDCIDEFSWEVFCGSGLETVIFDGNIKIIPNNAFLGTKLKEIILPASVKTIEFGAFSGCENLESIKLNEGLETIEVCAFASNPKLTEIIIPKTVKSVNEFAFVNCNNLVKVKFEGNAPAFQNKDAGLEEIYSYFTPKYTIYYHIDAEGFTSPSWEGFLSEIW